MLLPPDIEFRLTGSPWPECGRDCRSPIKILCFVPSLGGGGAEMHLVRLLNHFDRGEFELSLAVARGGGSYEPMLRDELSARRCGWDWIPSSTLRMRSAIGGLRQMIERERPSVVLAFLDHAVAATAKALSGLTYLRPPFIAGIQNNLEKAIEHLPGWSKRWLGPNILSAYARADHVIALSTGVANSLVKLVPPVQCRVTVVHNAGYDSDVERLSRQEPEQPVPKGDWFLACGRLTAQKDFATLLRAFAKVKNDVGGELWILGEGEQRRNLERDISKLGLSGRVNLPGFVKNPFAFMARASAFVLSSRWEGFGNVLTEAMACGTPIISTDCPYGPREILEDGKWGELVPVGDAEVLGNALRSSVRDWKRLCARAEAAHEYVTRFEASGITKQYEAVIRSVLAARKSRYES